MEVRISRILAPVAEHQDQPKHFEASGCGRWASRASVLDLHSKNSARIMFTCCTYTLEKKTLCGLLYCVYVNRAVVVQQTTTSTCSPLDLARALITCSRRPQYRLRPILPGRPLRVRHTRRRRRIHPRKMVRRHKRSRGRERRTEPS